MAQTGLDRLYAQCRDGERGRSRSQIPLTLAPSRYGVQLEPAEKLWYLRVPHNKYKGDFWTPIPQYTAEAILAWKAVRPPNQSSLPDRKTAKLTEYLFQYKGRRIGGSFLNQSLIVASLMQNIHKDAIQLVKLNDDQLLQPQALSLLDDMATNANSAHAGQPNVTTGEVQGGVIWIYEQLQTLAFIEVSAVKQ